ncbi:MAG: undecaprenyldiphospho-muramoylpentapeptide beta-N-acetylglucosaminyltransferase [Endomicrobiales bacterium]
MTDTHRIIIAAGGTGGHLYPGIALARELKNRGMEPVFIVRRNDPGEEILAREELRFREIAVAGLPRSLSLKLFRFVALFCTGLLQTWKLLKEIQPEAIAGMGGYISFPVVLMGRLQGIPTVIHEQNVLPGLSNRLLSHIVRKVAVSFEESFPCFPEQKTVLTGNPVRQELFQAPHDESCRNLKLSAGKFTVLVFGGSQGASGINRAVIECFSSLSGLEDRIQFLHIAGKKEFVRVESEYRKNNIPGVVLPYLHGIGEAYGAADLIICRSGATTVTELAILNKPAILIPFPFATANHQEFNAAVLVKKGLAVMMRESELTPPALADAIRKHFDGATGRENAPQLPGRPAQVVLADEILQLIR